jgi:hypothetical protein
MYESYAARGEDFARAVAELIAGSRNTDVAPGRNDGNS